jgi:hypothetical protein
MSDYLAAPRINSPDQPILNLHRHLLMHQRSIAMGKTTKSNKEVKKAAALTPKEKKTAKAAKKHASDVVPIIHR